MSTPDERPFDEVGEQDVDGPDEPITEDVTPDDLPEIPDGEEPV